MYYKTTDYMDLITKALFYVGTPEQIFELGRNFPAIFRPKTTDRIGCLIKQLIETYEFKSDLTMLFRKENLDPDKDYWMGLDEDGYEGFHMTFNQFIGWKDLFLPFMSEWSILTQHPKSLPESIIAFVRENQQMFFVPQKSSLEDLMTWKELGCGKLRFEKTTVEEALLQTADLPLRLAEADDVLPKLSDIDLAQIFTWTQEQLSILRKFKYIGDNRTSTVMKLIPFTMIGHTFIDENGRKPTVSLNTTPGAGLEEKSLIGSVVSAIHDVVYVGDQTVLVNPITYWEIAESPAEVIVLSYGCSVAGYDELLAQMAANMQRKVVLCRNPQTPTWSLTPYRMNPIGVIEMSSHGLANSFLAATQFNQPL